MNKNSNSTSNIEEILNSFKNSKTYKKFSFYNPYLTYSNSLNENFINPNGELDKELNADKEALFNIGLDSYKYLKSKTTDVEFNEGNDNYHDFIRLHRIFLNKLVEVKILEIKNEADKSIEINFESLDSGQILDICWDIYSKKAMSLSQDNDGNELNETDFIELYAYHALREIDNCLLGMKCDGSDAVCAAIRAVQALSNATAIDSREEKLIQARCELAYQGAIARIKRDPKQIALKEIKSHYESQKSQFKRRGYTAQFIREMYAKYPIISDQKTIANLVAKLNKTNETIPR